MSAIREKYEIHIVENEHCPLNELDRITIDCFVDWLNDQQTALPNKHEKALLEEVGRFFTNYCNSTNFAEYCGSQGLQWAERIRQDIAALSAIDEIVGE